MTGMARNPGLRRIHAKSWQEEQSGVLGPEVLRELSPDLIRKLADVLVTLDRGGIREVIARIRDRDASLADKLTCLVDLRLHTHHGGCEACKQRVAT